MSTMRKCYGIIGAVCLAFATLGFLVIPFVFDPMVQSHNQAQTKLEASQRLAFDFITEANRNRQDASLARDHADILAAVSAPEKTVDKKSNQRLVRGKYAAVAGLNAACAAKVVNDREFEREFRKVQFATNWADVHHVYCKSLSNAAAGTSRIQKKINAHEVKLGALNKLRSWLWVTSFAFQMAGLILGVISSIPTIKT